jgi:rod shape-determining protein MreC
MSGIYLLTDKELSFTGKTTKNSVTGVVKGVGGGRIFFGNVVLADKLDKNDTVTTKGDITGDGGGYPPDLIVGKITSVSKKDSALFQTAELKSLVDFSKLRIVFVMTN